MERNKDLRSTGTAGASTIGESLTSRAGTELGLGAVSAA